MISFAFTAKDQEILEEARAQARLAVKYARDFEHDEDRLLPHVYPEAEGRPDTRAMLREHEAETSGAKILHALLYLEDWRGGVPLREARYSLGNTVLKIAGTPEQYARWADKTIAIGLTEPQRRLRSRLDAHHGDLGRGDAGMGDRRREALHHLRRELRRRAGARAARPSRAARPLDLHRGEGNARIQRRASIPQDGHPVRGHRAARFCGLPDSRIQPYRRRSEKDAAILQRVAACGRRLCARRFSRGAGLHLGEARRDRHNAGLRQRSRRGFRGRRSPARAGS